MGFNTHLKINIIIQANYYMSIKYTLLKNISEFQNKKIIVKGWLTNKRSSKNILFINFRDGSGFCQCIAEKNAIGEDNFQQLNNLQLESVLELEGLVVENKRQLEGYEINIHKYHILNKTEDYPIANKSHGADFLLDNRHLWLRSKRQWAIMRVRNRTIVAINAFLQSKDFIQTDSPIFTSNACEGTTDLFEVAYYDTQMYLSQSGQLYGEALALALGRIYTFGPTFRAEKSKTRRHLTEFWMMEPEMVFFDLNDTMNLIEEFIRYVVQDILKNCKYELDILERDTCLLEKITQPFIRLTYHQAVKILKGEETLNGQNALEVLEKDLENINIEIQESLLELQDAEEKIGLNKSVKEVGICKVKVADLKNKIKILEEKSKNIPLWIQSARNFKFGADFGGSDETILTRLSNTPVMVYNWPQEIKAFYLKRDENDSQLAKGVDVLAPEGYGEIIGGGERETDYDLLLKKIKEHKLPENAFNWYLDLRKYGSVKHSGFGLGLERFVSWLCKLKHLREAIPFPRTYKRIQP